MSEPEKSPSTLAIRSAMARRDYWIEEQRLAQENGDSERATLCARFITEYDELLAAMGA